MAANLVWAHLSLGQNFEQRKCCFTFLATPVFYCWNLYNFYSPFLQLKYQHPLHSRFQQLNIPAKICLLQSNSPSISLLKPGWQPPCWKGALVSPFMGGYKGWQHRHRELDYCGDDSSDDDGNDKRTMPVLWVLGKQSWQLKESTVAMDRLISTTKTTTASPT